MSYQHEDGRGSLFKNSESTPENKRPHYSGDLMINGTLYSLGAWINQAEGKKTFMALRASPKVSKADREPAPRREDDFSPDSSLPF